MHHEIFILKFSWSTLFAYTKINIIYVIFLQGLLCKVSSWYGTEKSSPHVPFVK